MLDIPNVIEELNYMLEKHIDVTCSIEYISLDRTGPQKVWSSISHAGLEEAIPLLFQADIDQYCVTDISTQQVVSHTEDAFAYYINIRLQRCI